jgi:D-amino-acid dehydrogenase
MPQDIIVLGAGIVGVSVALQLCRHGHNVVLVDRQGPGEGTSFGNAGLIQREAVFPYHFPREISELSRIVRNRSIDAVYHPAALPALASPLLRYWWHAHPDRYVHAVQGHAALIATCLDEHLALAEAAGATALLRPIGFLRIHATESGLANAVAQAERAHQEHGVNFKVLDGPGITATEPHLQIPKAGAIHWTDPLSVSDPHALTVAYAKSFTAQGGRIALGDAATLASTGAGWRVTTQDGAIEAPITVVALGAASVQLTKRFGYTPPLFGKRGYHMHYSLRGNAFLQRPVLDADSGFLLAPMRAGIRLTTGAEFAHTDAPSTPVQLARAEPIARALLPLDERVDATPWLGVRPCIPDMLPVIGKLPQHKGLWAAFGHAHQGLTLGPTTGRLIAEMIDGQTPFLDPTPYRPDRF